MGRVLQSTQTTAGAPGPYQMSYGYDLAGDKTSETYPSGRVVTTSYDAAGRISQVSGQKAGSGSKVYSSSYSYSPHGGVTGVSLAGGAMRETMIYNSRLQATQTELRIQSTNALLLGLDYTFSQTNNNGNLQSQTIRIGASITINQTYSYDQVNRLQSATETGAWTQSYGYDQYGNRWVSGMNDYIPPASQGLTPLNQNAFNAATNRIVASQYDTSGNQTQDGRGNQYTYDSENRQLTFNTTVGRYYYDGGGNRVKVEGMTGVIYVYDIMGQLVAEYTSVAAANEGTSYLTTDHLGSTRLVTSGGPNPAVKARYDYLPFGGEIEGVGGRLPLLGYSPGQGKPRQKFTSKERDNESGLDYFLARYYSSAQGRFTSADDPLVSQVEGDPQSWNLYAYARNNPILDRWGNRTSLTNTGLPPAINPGVIAGSNRLSGFSYDNAGNVTADNAGDSFSYDAEGKQETHTRSGVTTTHYYDGDGNRVKVEGTTGVIYVYDIMGQLVAEYTSVAAANEGTSYLTTDHLGSTRLVMSGGANPAVKARYDYLPFGEEIGAGIGGRTTAMGYSPGQGEPRQKFTSKERDSESGLDYFLARYYSSAQGRFASPDPYIPVVNIEKEKEFKQYLAEPRNWNRYVYVWDNPLRYIDPFGEKVYVVTYTTGNARGDEEFKRVAETRAQEIRNSEGFDREKDTIILRGVKTKEDFEGVIMEANGLEDKYGKIDEISLVSHSGSGDGPTFQFGTPQRSQYPKERLSQLWFNWSKTAEARFFGCNTAVNFCQNFANAQGVPSWGFDTFSSLSGRPDQKSKFYWVQSWVTPWVQTRRYMVGREDGRGMVRRDPAPKDRSRR